MRRALSWAFGFIVGAAIGGMLVLLFAPSSGDDLVRRIRQGYDQTMLDAHKAAEERRLELEARLELMRKGQA